MPDPRIEEYARLLVERCVHVEPGWQVVIRSSPLARPLIEEVIRNIARRGAYALLRLGFGTQTWLAEAPTSIIGQLPPITQYEAENMDAIIAIGAPENTREGSDVSAERLGLQAQAVAGEMDDVEPFDRTRPAADG